MTHVTVDINDSENRYRASNASNARVASAFVRGLLSFNTWQQKTSPPTDNSKCSNNGNKTSLDPEPDELVPAVVRTTSHHCASVHQLQRHFWIWSWPFSITYFWRVWFNKGHHPCFEEREYDLKCKCHAVPAHHFYFFVVGNWDDLFT